MRFPTYGPAVANRIERIIDDVRYSVLALGIQRIEDEGIPGAFAELGVYRGTTSCEIHSYAPTRKLYLFDTFEGFPESELEAGPDPRFRDCSQEFVAERLGDTHNVIFRKGFFPQTAEGLEDEQFAMVMIDCDLYATALKALHFFYPRTSRGGYIFLHDYNSPESQHGISRAVTEFLADKPELIIEIPDISGTALFRKF